MNEQVQALQARAEEMHAGLNALDGKVQTLANEVANQRAQNSAALTSFNERAESDRATHNTEHTEALNEFRTKLTALENAATTQRTEEKTEADDQRLRHSREFAEHLETWTEGANQEFDAKIEQSNQVIEELRAQLTEAKHLVEMIGEVTMTGHYQKNAVEQKRDADRWRLATVAAGGMAVISAAVLTIGEIFFPHESDWSDIVTRSGLTLALTGLAAFLGSQSLRHRRREEDYRALELELATLDPFLNSLDEEERKRIKAELALRYFVGVEREPIEPEDVGQRR